MRDSLAFVGVAFAAFAVWLTVRIINRRERWAKCTAVGVIAASVFVGGYVTGYTHMVRPGLPEKLLGGFLLPPFGNWRIDLVPDYSGFDPETGEFAGRNQAFWEKVFAPAHWVDRRIRRDEWVIEQRDELWSLLDGLGPTEDLPE